MASTSAPTVVLIVLVRRIDRFVPGALTTVVLSSVLVAMFGWAERISTVGPLTARLPQFQFPPLGLDTVRALASGSLVLALLDGTEPVAIAKAIAGHSGERIDANREFSPQK